MGNGSNICRGRAGIPDLRVDWTFTRYRITPTGRGSPVHASVAIRRCRGLAGRLVAQAAGAVLAAGTLQVALGLMARQLEGQA